MKLSKEKTTDLVGFLRREIDYAQQARNRIVGDNQILDENHRRYEGGDRNLTKDTPWPGASNLGSWIITEKVDSMRARMVATLFSDPIWIVDGWGGSAERAPFVEEFHKWKAEEEKLQSYVARALHNSLIEGTGVLECSDRVVLRKDIRKMNVLLQRDPATGSVILNEQGEFVPVRDKLGKYVPAQDQEPAITTYVSHISRATAGPSYRVLSLRDFYILPGHATEVSDIWGYAKRVFIRLPDLQCRERDGFYEHVDLIGKQGEREQTRPELQAGIEIAPQYDLTAEKEIWEVTLLADLDDDEYEEWYVITFHYLSGTILRVQYQDFDTPHYVLFRPFPRPNSVYGYSFADDKLGSVYDEHTAIRNMFMDRVNLVTNAPFLQIQNGLWKPAEKPWGPLQVIPVLDLNEVKQLEVRDVPGSVIQAMNIPPQASERLSGMNDTTTGQLATQDRTLGEVELVTKQSWIRIDEAVHNCQEAMEDLFALRHLIWINKLEQDPEQIPGSLLDTMTERGLTVDLHEVTADMLQGTFRGKPHNSVEGADYGQMRGDISQLMIALTQIAQAVPAVAQHLNNPTVVRSIMTQIARVYRWPDRANLVGTFTGTFVQPPALAGPTGPPPPQSPLRGTRVIQ